MANAINTWAGFQDFMDECCRKVGADPDFSGHGRWWRQMTYDQFVTDGKVKGERIVVVGDPANSILIHSLRGDTPDFTDGGRYGRMPLNAVGYFDEADIDEIGDWIGRGCPNPA
jgi:hypothetical protein